MRLPARPLHPRVLPKKCELGHAMLSLNDPMTAWYCDHPLCGVLTVIFDSCEAKKFTGGNRYLYFTEAEADPFLRGWENIQTLVERSIGKENFAELNDPKHKKK